MNFLNKIGSILGTAPRRTLVGKDRRGNEFYTAPHSREGMLVFRFHLLFVYHLRTQLTLSGLGEPAKRLVEYNGAPEPSELHPLWKHWLIHASEAPPTEKDIYVWEMEQVRLQRRLKEIDAASNKMQSEEMAQRERSDSGMATIIAQLTSQLDSDVGASRQASKASQTSPPAAKFVVPPQAPIPKAGSNLAFEDGKQVIPKTHTPYAPDPSRIQSIVSKSKEAPSNASNTATGPPNSSWNPNTKPKDTNLDEL